MELYDLVYYSGIIAISYYAASFVSSIVRELYVHFGGAYNCKKRLQSYGSWVVITGATGGLGSEWANQFAEWGFNLILLGIPDSSLTTMAHDLAKKYKVKVHPIHNMDLTTNDYSEYDKLKFALMDKDVGILINNAGVIDDVPSEFTEIPQRKVAAIVDVNAKALSLVAQIVMQECFLPRKKGLLMNMSSASCHKVPWLSVYACSKAYVRDLTETLAVEYNEYKNIHFQYFTPMFINTDMVKYMDQKAISHIFIPSASTFVKHAKWTLGMGTGVVGYFPHVIQIGLTLLPPESWRMAITKMRMREFQQKAVNKNK